MRKGQMLAGLAAVFLLGCGADNDNSAVPDSSPWISLNSVAVDTRGPLPVLPAHLSVPPGDAAAEQVVLVKFPGPIMAEQDQALRRAVTQVYTYLPYYSYLVKMPAEERAAGLLASIGATWSGPYHPGYKISRHIAAVRADDPMGSEDVGPEKSVMLQVYPDADLDRVVDAIKGLGISDIPGWKTNPFFSRIRVMLTPGQIVEHRERLAQIPEVFWVDIEPRKVLLNDTTIWVGQSGLNGGMATPVFDKGIYGQGQIVGIIDTGIDPDMCYFRDPALGLPPRNECNGGTVVNMAQRKVIAVDFLWSSECNGGIASNEWDNNDHGSHVAGTVAGDNFANPLVHDTGDGMAPGAKLVIQDCGFQTNNCADCPGIGCPVVDLNPIFQQAYDQGARIHTNSWGDQENANPMNDYTTACQDVDEFMWNHKDFLLFFAAGNSGPGTATVGSPSTAKSTVSVGSTQRGTNAGSMSSFSSCGPTDDGRIKPEITIPGSQISSANSDNNINTNNCNLASFSGTSMASPGAAGLTALIRQYYTDGWYPSGTLNPADSLIPTGALLRATLINSGQIMNNGIIPANCQAWGRILLDNALYFPPDVRKLWVVDDAGFNTGSSNESKTFNFTVLAGTPFKATLAWTDYPSTPAAMPHINNDLDLEVVTPNATYRGNVFSGGQSYTGGNFDRINTLEQVFRTAPVAGNYTVTVRSFNVPNGPQPFALVVTAALAPPGSPGTGCMTAADCLSGFCVDGVCCTSACNAGACDACSTAAGAPVDGTCALLTGTACNDANACTQTDTCQTGVCVGSNPVVCTASDTCHDVGACDSATGTCSNPVKPDGSACDDADRCTQTDGCQAGVCVGTNPVVCPTPDACHDVGTCDAATGMCSNPPKADGTTCDDGDGCLQGETCQAGECLGGTPVVCPAPDDCHDPGTCDSATGTCSNPPKADGTPCPNGECMSGVCVPTTTSSSSSTGSAGGSTTTTSSSATGTGATGTGGTGGAGGPDIEVDGGCGCRMASSPQGGGMGIGLGLLLVLRRRRRQRPRDRS